MNSCELTTLGGDLLGRCPCAPHSLQRLVNRLIDEGLPTGIDAVQEIVGEMFTLLADVAPAAWPCDAPTWSFARSAT